MSVSKTAPEEMSQTALREEYADLRGQEFDTSLTDEQADRARELWNELESRVETDYPCCPRCGETDWGQSVGDPVTCNSCGRELAAGQVAGDEQRLARINDQWDRVLGAGGDE